jgi:hypothetical protein
MSKRIGKSAKGETVDFDLLETKQKMEDNKPRAIEVRQREDFVHTKRRSRGRRSVMQRLKEKKATESSKSSQKEEPNTSKKKTAPDNTKTSSKPAKKKKTRRKIVKDEK